MAQQEKGAATLDHNEYPEDVVREVKLDKSRHGEQDITDLDVSNTKAFKGDASDGKVTWTPRTVLAFLSLSGQNAGILPFLLQPCSS